MMQQYDKMILAILQGDDYHDAVHSLNEHGFYATVLNSSGGFLKKRSVTLMIGLESARLDEALAILKKHGERTEMRYEAPVLSPNMPPIPLSTAPLEIPTRCGDYVIIVNVEKAVLTGRKLEEKYYRRHSGWIGGLKETKYKTLMAERPEFAMELAVKGMLPKNSIGRAALTRLKLYKGAEHNNAAQKPEAWTLD